MTCKDCIHYDICEKFYTDEDMRVLTYCSDFKDKSKYIELPCKVGDTVYQADRMRIYQSRIKNIIFDTDGVAFDKNAIGKTVFLTREEAEKKLEENSKANRY